MSSDIKSVKTPLGEFTEADGEEISRVLIAGLDCSATARKEGKGYVPVVTFRFKGRVSRRNLAIVAGMIFIKKAGDNTGGELHGQQLVPSERPAGEESEQ